MRGDITDTFIDSKIFSKTYSFAGNILSGPYEEGPFSIEITLSLTNDRPPRGVIHGNDADYDRLENFVMKSSSFQRIESISKDPDREIFIAEEVIIRSISRKFYPRDEIEHINQVIGVFDVVDIKIEKYFKVEKSLLRAATFFLCGPCQEWGTKSLQTTSYTGEVNVEHFQVERHISGVDDIDIKVQTQFLYDENENGSDQSDLQNIFLIVISRS